MLNVNGIFEIIVIMGTILVSIAYFTVSERKTMGSMQRRLGPNIVGYFGLLQAFADALKLLLKEYVSPTQANIILFFLGPIITLTFSLLSYGVIPFNPGLAINDFNMSIFYFLAVSSLSTYGILLAGWSANSKYAFLGSLRSTAQLISYELVLSSTILVVIMLTGNLNFTVCIESQRSVYYAFPLLPLFIIFFIGSVAETNRAPFDLAEAESELVSGFMTEHAAVIFVFFFLAEYGSILLICILTDILFLGGYLFNIEFYLYIIDIFLVNVLDILLIIINYISILYSYFIYYTIYITFKIFGFNINELVEILILDKLEFSFLEIPNYFNISLLEVYYELISYGFKGLIYGLIMGIKISILVFIFIWVRASFPRIRFDQLMVFCWTILLPIIFAFIIYIPFILHSFNIFTLNIKLL